MNKTDKVILPLAISAAIWELLGWEHLVVGHRDWGRDQRSGQDSGCCKCVVMVRSLGFILTVMISHCRLFAGESNFSFIGIILGGGGKMVGGRESS